MAITLTTLAAALSATDTLLTVASATGITAPNFQTASGITVLIIEQEQVLVLAVSGVVIGVLRGQNGTQQVAHANGANVRIGLPSDFTNFQQVLGNVENSLQQIAATRQNGVNLTGTADAIDPSVPAFYVVRGTAINAMTLAQPAVGDEGVIIDIWSASAYAHTVTAASNYFAVGASANKTVCTFPAFVGAGIKLRVCNQLYHLLGSGGTGTNSGPVVWT